MRILYIARKVFILMLLLSSTANGEDVECSLQIKESGVYSRNTPYVYYDQALGSLPQMYPKHVLVTSRRFGIIGATEYSLVAYKTSSSSDEVAFEGLAGSYKLNKTWLFNYSAPSNQVANSMICILERLSALTAKEAAQ